MKKWRLNPHDISSALMSLTLNGTHVHSVSKKNAEEYLEKVKKMERPSFCSYCEKVHEYSKDDFGNQEANGVWYHYCGCRGWD